MYIYLYTPLCESDVATKIVHTLIQFKINTGNLL